MKETERRHIGIKVDHHIGLFPFFQSELPLHQKLGFHSLLFIKTLVYGIVEGLSLLPPTILRLLGKEIGNLEGHALETYVDMVQGALLRNCVYLGESEFRDLRQEYDLKYLQDNHSRITLYFTANDKWAPDCMYNRLRRALPNRGNVIYVFPEAGVDIVHGFVVDKRQCARLAPLTLAPLHLLRSKL